MNTVVVGKNNVVKTIEVNKEIFRYGNDIVTFQIFAGLVEPVGTWVHCPATPHHQLQSRCLRKKTYILAAGTLALVSTVKRFLHRT